MGASPLLFRQTISCLFNAANNSHNSRDPQDKSDDDDDDAAQRRLDYDLLQHRLLRMRAQVLEEEFRQPPNPQLSAKEFIKQILHALWNSSQPLPDAGFRVLLRSATQQWRQSLYQSVGAPSFANEEVVASALGETIGRPNNQFAILVADDDNNNNADSPTSDVYSLRYDGPEGEMIHQTIPYLIDFPSDELDYGDGTCWVECRLRGKKDKSLYVIMGWQLHQRDTDGAWLVDHIDWQDFRDEFRPGIGREEWMRICG
ncbi:hypothetical protein ACA910_021708 [Epithemia clementina (nom. ined.)]